MKNGKIKDIVDYRDAIDLNGFCLTLDLRRGADPDTVMDKLFYLTELENSFDCNFNIFDDSFGITALCSIGPIISVLVLGLVVEVNGEGGMSLPTQPADTRDGVLAYLSEIVHYAKEVAIALLPIIVFTVFFQLVSHAFSKTQLIRIFIGGKTRAMFVLISFFIVFLYRRRTPLSGVLSWCLKISP